MGSWQQLETQSCQVQGNTLHWWWWSRQTDSATAATLSRHRASDHSQSTLRHRQRQTNSNRSRWQPAAGVLQVALCCARLTQPRCTTHITPWRLQSYRVQPLPNWRTVPAWSEFCSAADRRRLDNFSITAARRFYILLNYSMWQISLFWKQHWWLSDIIILSIIYGT